MKITVDVEATAEVEIELTEEDIFEVMQEYNGDFQEWAKDNYREHLDCNSFNTDFDGCFFDKNEARELILKSKDILGIDENGNIDKTIANRTILKKLQCNIPVLDDEIKEVLIDVELISKAINFADINNPREELNYIYLNEDIIIATDSRKLIQMKNHKYNFSNAFLPPSFIEPLKNDGKLFIDKDSRFYLNYNNQWYKGACSSDFNNQRNVFLDIDGILLNDDYKVHFSFQEFLSSAVSTKIKDRVKITFTYESCCIEESFYSEIIDMQENFQDVYILKNEPIHFMGKDIEVVGSTVSCQ